VNSTARKVAFCGILTALALVLSYLERLIPVPVPVPGIKLGLANAAVLILLYHFGVKEAFTVSVTRIALAGLLFAGVSGTLYSLAGGLLSFVMMWLAKKAGVFSVTGVSIAGGVFHNVGQILLACVVVQNIKLLYYMPVLIAMGMAMGAVTGVIAVFSLRYLKSARTSGFAG